jgi:hypothetical protein
MSILKAQTAHIVEGIRACNGKDHKVWLTNFNMPVSDLFTGACTMENGWIQTYCNTMEFTTRDLSSFGFCPGFEVAESTVVFYWCVFNDSLNGNGCARQCWTRGTTNIASAANSISVNLSAGPDAWQWSFWQFHYMTGTDSDEVCINCTYCADTRVTCTSGDDISISNCNLDLCWQGVPSTARCSSSLRGSIWVEGNNLHFINANCWEHSMAGICQGSGASSGAIWIDTNHYLNWANAGGSWYRACWRLCQFCSTFSNSSGPNPSPGSSFQGAIWADCEFGWTHLAYIGCDGNKYITGSGRDPTE